MSGDYANQWLKAAQEARELEARCAQLEAERNEYAERLAWHREERDAYLKGNLWVKRAAEEQSRAEVAEAEVERLTEGLRFYADPSTYEESSEPDPKRFATGIIPIRDDQGAKARALLAGSEAEPDGGGAK